MGWDYTYKDPKESVKEFFEREFRGNVVGCAVVGNEAYIAYNDNGVVYAIVCLLDKRTNDPRFNFGYKSMDEGMHPYSYKCPKRILDLLSPVDVIYSNPSTAKSALEWRIKNGYKEPQMRKKSVKKTTTKRKPTKPR